METAAALSSVFQVWQSKAYHNEEMSKAFEFFSKEVKQNFTFIWSSYLINNSD